MAGRLRAAQCVALAGLVAMMLAGTTTGSAGTGQGLQFRTIEHDGLQREFFEYTPSSLAEHPALVFGLHGGAIQDASALTEPKDPFSHLMTLADEDGFVVIYPSGVDNNWNDCRSDTEITGDADDVGFISALIDDQIARHNVDPSRVYSTGISNGGMMSYRLAMELTERIAAVGAVVANLPVDPEGACRAPTLPVGVFVINGDQDRLMPWDGGCVAPAGVSCDRGSVLSTHDTIDFWVSHNGATPAAQGFVHPQRDDRPEAQVRETRVVRYDYEGAANVSLFHVEGGGHLAPSREHNYTPAGDTAIGPQNRDIEAMAELWMRFQQHQRLDPIDAGAEPTESDEPAVDDDEATEELPVTGVSSLPAAVGLVLLVAWLSARRLTGRTTARQG